MWYRLCRLFRSVDKHLLTAGARSIVRRERKAVRAYASLLRTEALCRDVGRVVLNVTPGDCEF